jgi:predicted PurR-regulated permease PerM
MGPQAAFKRHPIAKTDAIGRGFFEGKTDAFSMVVEGIASIFIVLFIGIYGAISPHFYIDSAIRLFPTDKRERIREVFRATGHALHWWLVGQIAAMVVVGILTGIGLMIIGIPLALALALIAALFSFIPFLGPVISAVPAVLIAFLKSPTSALYVVIVFILVQTVESYFITPQIQQRAVSFPPAFLISMQILMGVLFGPLGVLMATPATVVVVVVVQMLYIEDTLGDSVEIVGGQHAT